MATSHNRHNYTTGEEIAHSLTHGVGLLLGTAALVLMVVFAAAKGTAVHIVAGCTYGITLMLLYTASTLYHALPEGRAKRVFQTIDHASIFLLIAGTYTPFSLITLHGVWGWVLFSVVWSLAVIGVLMETLGRTRRKRIQIGLYLLMGWACLIAIRPLWRALDSGGLFLLFMGGVAYTLGVLFYVNRWFRFHHAVWHLFVLAGSICHFFAVFYYVLP